MATLIPTNMVQINRDGDFTKKESSFAENFPCLLSSSILNLLEDKKAISTPEKKAEISKVIIRNRA